MATRLRDAIKATYGRDHEKLTEFGVPVRRPRTTSAEEKKKKQAEKGPNPDQSAASVTRGTTWEVTAAQSEPAGGVNLRPRQSFFPLDNRKKGN